MNAEKQAPQNPTLMVQSKDGGELQMFNSNIKKDWRYSPLYALLKGHVTVPMEKGFKYNFTPL